MPRRDSGGTRLLLALLPFALTLGIGGDLGTTQGEVILARYFGSMLEGGSITLLTLGSKLVGMPATLIGAALGTALLPAASRAAKSGNSAALMARVRLAITTSLLFAAPLVVVYLDAPNLVASTVLAGRSLRPEQVAELESILRAFAPAIVGWTLVLVLGNALAATGAAIFLVASAVIAIVGGAIMMKFFSVWYGAPGIAFSISFCSILYVAQMGVKVVRYFRSTTDQPGLLGAVAIIVGGAVGMHLLMVAARGSLSILAALPLVLVLYFGWSILNRARLHLGEAFTT
jgi:putative peptidoglycan lipid II flippase